MAKKIGKQLQRKHEFRGEATENYRLVGFLETDTPPVYRIDVFRDIAADNPATKPCSSARFTGVMAHAFIENDRVFDRYCKFIQELIQHHILTVG